MCKCNQCNKIIKYGKPFIHGLYDTKFCSFECFVGYFEPSIVTPQSAAYDDIMSGADLAELESRYERSFENDK